MPTPSASNIFSAFWLPLIFAVSTLSVSADCLAKTLAASAEELEISYETSYRTLYKKQEASQLSAHEDASWHAAHLDGLLQSPDWAEQFGLSKDLTEGFGGIKTPKILSAKVMQKENDEYLWVTYRFQGKVLLIERVVNAWLKNKATGTAQWPMLEDMPAIYTNKDADSYANPAWQNCTDPHYNTAEDFFYFINPFVSTEPAASICAKLRQSPIGKAVTVALQRLGNTQSRTEKFPVEAMKSSNGNGKLAVLYFVHGFDESLEPGSPPEKIRRDIGWKLYSGLDKFLVKNNQFQKMDGVAQLREKLGDDFKYLNLDTPVSMNHDLQRRYFSTYIKREAQVTWVVRSALFDTSNTVSTEPTVSFPKFWKEAWENGDFIYYNGHSGSGESLSLESMKSNLNQVDLKQIKFKPHKTQVAVFDGCSTYGHYQDMYTSRKPARLHMVTFGVVSLYHLAEVTTQTFLNTVFHSLSQPLWTDLLGKVEQNQLKVQMDFYYQKPSAEEMYRHYLKQKEYPNLLLNVWVP